MDPFGGHICRLCFSDRLSLIDIYDGCEANIPEILNKHIGEVSEADALPKFICSICFQKVSEFHEFYCGVRVAQQNFVDNAIKMEISAKAIITRDPTETEYSFKNVETNDIEFAELSTATNNDHSGALVEVIEFPTDEMFDDKEEFHGTATIKVENIEIDEDIQEEVSESDTDDEVEKKPKYEKLNKATIVNGIEQHFQRTCDLCPFQIKSLNRAIKHYQSEHNVEGYLKCCNLKFKRPVLVEDHVRWHLNPKVFKCEYCDRYMKTRLSLSTHVSTHRHPKEFICDICNKKCVKLHQLEIHMKKHLRQRIKATKCRYCSKVFNDGKLRQHISDVHNIEVEKQLEELLEFSKTEIDTQQMMMKHFDMNCENCDTQFTSIEDAQYHYHAQHEMPKGYVKCCGYQYTNHLLARDHLLCHVKPELFLCRLCAMRLNSLGAFKRHANKHDEEGIGDIRKQCTECKKTFRTVNGLIIHMTQRHKANGEMGLHLLKFG